MPARHDILTGRLEFLEHNWSGIQPYDYTLPQALRKAGIFSHMATDHYHYFQNGGENYPFLFDSWELMRGQEHDSLVPKLGRQEEREHYGCYHTQYELNRQSFKGESDYPSPKTFGHGAEFVDKYHSEDNWFLFIDSSDPHEPFDVPEDIDESYEDTYDDKLFYWPKYETSENLPAHALEHIRKQYAKTLTMSDKWLGKLLDKMDEHGLWEDTLVILTSDHGLMLGEHALMGKNYMPAYNEIYHLPLLIHMPGQTENKKMNALTQNIDLFSTLLEFFGIDAASCPDKLHGKSLIPLLDGKVDKLRDTAIYGVFGKQVNITDGRYTYFRSAVREDNSPISLYTALPTTMNHYWDREHIHDISKIEAGRFLKWTQYPVFKIAGSNVMLFTVSHRFDVRYEIQANNMLFDIQKDYTQQNNICGGAEEERMCGLLRKALFEHDSPDEQFIRLGL
jgi:arylsulfatase A-like enzyme